MEKLKNASAGLKRPGLVFINTGSDYGAIAGPAHRDHDAFAYDVQHGALQIRPC
jgi:hypothetical protein